jgi:hypothetical protein
MPDICIYRRTTKFYSLFSVCEGYKLCEKGVANYSCSYVGTMVDHWRFASHREL